MKSKNILIPELESLGYDSDPVKAWKRSVSDQLTVEEKDHESTDREPDYNYLLSMPFWNLTKEKAGELLHTRDKKVRVLLMGCIKSNVSCVSNFSISAVLGVWLY